ncbi:FAD-dependent oxidoreductase [Sphingobacterium thalpophilum]|uniref:FAD-dependent oxidoreductase n=1 Tax=Sphingobacterium TaxID=28453 RepID=UPI002243B860|nr:FAD-dependent oxidoreductase [Sphingobacterium sp. InxBP1]MCW8313178.1 FAD-dependent oxidoreductase [Sphingobacterium sp. InxBP1]
MQKIKITLKLVLALAFFQVEAQHLTKKVDVLVYGGTPAAITAALQVKQGGRSVVVVSPDKHLGGMSSGGLGFTDTGNKTVIGGLAKKFYQDVYEHYSRESSWHWQSRASFGNRGQGTVAMDSEHSTMWIFEPHVAENIFDSWVRDHEIEVVREAYLDRRESSIEKQGTQIKSIKTLDGTIYEAKIFIDATYEGDLMALAKVTYTIGREANQTYGERWNGVQTGVFQHRHHFVAQISPYNREGDPRSGLVFGVSDEDPGLYGTADKKLQAYCFRMCLTNDPRNRKAIPKPSNYDPHNYVLLQRLFRSGWNEPFQKFDMVPNNKTDANNHGPFSTDFIGMNYSYPEASYVQRKAIVEAHRNYQMGLYYFMGNDPSVPAPIREKMAEWGLAKDEFQDNDNWPFQLYIREARRMVGQLVTTEQHIFGKRKVEDPIGMGSYTLDSHNVQRYVTEEGYVQNEGDIGVHVPQPYAISYRSIIPKGRECTNLLVPVCLSSSHIAFGSIRMEPVFMVLGQSAGCAANLALDNDGVVQHVDYGLLKKQLLDSGQVLEQK